MKDESRLPLYLEGPNNSPVSSIDVINNLMVMPAFTVSTSQKLVGRESSASAFIRRDLLMICMRIDQAKGKIRCLRSLYGRISRLFSSDINYRFIDKE
jgi:hypothetical protein